MSVERCVLGCSLLITEKILNITNGVYSGRQKINNKLVGGFNGLIERHEVCRHRPKIRILNNLHHMNSKIIYLFLVRLVAFTPVSYTHLLLFGRLLCAFKWLSVAKCYVFYNRTGQL